MAETKDLTIVKGKTFSLIVRWGLDKQLTYKAVTAIQQTAPVRLTVPLHGIPDGWDIAVTNVKGMTEINAVANAVKSSDYHYATVIDPNTIEINDINAAGFKPYVSGGFIQYATPADFTGQTPRMKIKTHIDGPVLASSELEDAPLNIITLSVNALLHAVTIGISATDSAAITWKKGVTDLEMVDQAGGVKRLKLFKTPGDPDLPDPVRVVGEITT